MLACRFADPVLDGAECCNDLGAVNDHETAAPVADAGCQTDARSDACLLDIIGAPFSHKP